MNEDELHTQPVGVAEKHLTEVLHKMAGPLAVPREDQLQAVDALVRLRARVLVVQATGWGKSAVYWAATSAIRAAGAGPTLVISPLLALMRDQVSAAQRAGLAAATINSTNVDAWDDILQRALGNQLDVLLVSPERLANPRFAHALPRLLSAAGLIVIDEAHCISDWGFDFRPDYQRLATTLLAAGSSTPVLATTATANERVTLDVATQLGPDTLTYRGSLARSSLALSVVPNLTAIERYAWVAEAIDHIDGSGIIYTLTVAETERLSGFLASQGHEVAAYSGALAAEEREQIEDRLRANELKAVVATSALGMGYDKPDLAFCIHVGSPSSPVAYYQQVGRAGRALDNAVAVLLPAETDAAIWEHFATAGVPDEKRVGAILGALGNGSASVLGLETQTSIRRGRLEGLLKILAVEGIVSKAETGSAWQLTGKQWVYDADRWNALAEVRASEAGLMRTYAAGSTCLMRTLQVALDDPQPSDCGRCSVCTGVVPDPGLRASVPFLQAAKDFCRGRDVVLEPRKLWPTGVAGRKGKIVGAESGRALAFADDPGWIDELQAMRDSPASDELLAGMVAVLGRWRRTWKARPVAVVPLATPGHGILSWSIAKHLGQVGSLEVIDALSVSGRLPGRDVPSGGQVSARITNITLRPGVAIPSGPILVVDALYGTGWSMTVAAALLRDAGATQVLPLVVQQFP